MESDLYTVRVESDVAGMVVRSSSAALESSLPTMSLYDDKGTYIAVSEQVCCMASSSHILAGVQCH